LETSPGGKGIEMLRRPAGVTASLLVVAAALAAIAGASEGDGQVLTGSVLRLTGHVRDVAGKPLAGVTVQAFEGGRLLRTTQSDVEGGYALETALDFGARSTVGVYWVSPRQDLVPEVVLLREGERDRALQMWSPCIPRVTIEPEMVRDIELVDHETHRRRLIESQCFRDSGGTP
jgi:hypothetical protein